MRLLTILCFCLLVGCSTTTRITMEDGATMTVKSGRYELVEVKRGDVLLKIDKRGRPSIIEQIAALWGESGIHKEVD